MRAVYLRTVNEKKINLRRMVVDLASGVFRWRYMIAGVELIINKNLAQNDFETKSG